MPLARIITRTPQDAVGASELLRSRGYTVETVSPDEFRITPAELELNLQHCGAAEGVERALAMVESATTSPAKAEKPAVPVPESLAQVEKIPIAYDITGQPVEFAEPEKRSKPNPAGSGKALTAMLTGLRRPWSDFRQRRAGQRALKLEALAARQREEARRRDLEAERQRDAAELAERRRQEQVAAEQHAPQEREIVAALREAAAQPQEPAENPTVLPPSAARAVPEAKPLPRLPAPREAPRQLLRPVQVRRRRAPIVISRTAVATSCALGLLLLAGFVAYANRRPASQFLPEAPQQVRQDVPFGAATAAPVLAGAKPATAGKHSTAARPASRKPSAAQPSARRASREGTQDEVVVRHLHPAQPQPSTAKLTRHSDGD